MGTITLHLAVRLSQPIQVFAVIVLCFICGGGQPQAGRPELLIQNGHTGVITAIAYSPVGTLFVTGGDDYVVKLWDERTGQLQNNFVGHSGIISCLAFSRNGELIVSGSQDGTVRLWSVKESKLVRVFAGHKSAVLSVAFSPDSKFIASAGGSYESVSDNSVRIWEAETGRLFHLLKSHTQGVNSVAFTPDGETIASASGDATVKFWSSRTGEIKNTFYNKDYLRGDARPRNYGVDFIQFSPDGSSFATLDQDVIKIRSTADGHLLRLIRHPTSPWDSLMASRATFSPDWKKVFVLQSSEHESYLFSLEDGRLLGTLKGEDTVSQPVASFSNDAKRIIMGSWRETSTLDPQTLKTTNGIASISGETSSAVFSQDGTLIAWASDCELKLWDARAGHPIEIAQQEDSLCVESLAFSPDGKTLVTGGDESGVRLWSVERRRLIQSLGESNKAHAVAFSPDGRTIAWGSDTLGKPFGEPVILNLWDLQSKKTLRRITLSDSLTGRVDQLQANFSIAFSPDGRLVAAGGTRQVVRVWDVQSGELIHELKGNNYDITSISFSPDGKTIASGSTDIKLWSAKSGQLINSFGNHTDIITQVAFSSDSKTLASAGRDRMIKIWDIPNGELSRSFGGHASKVNSVSFSPDGKTLVTSSADATTRLWSVKTGDWTVSFMSWETTEWIAYTPDRYFEASAGAVSNLHWRVNGGIVDISRYRREYYKPDIVLGRSRGLLTPFPTASVDTESIPVITSPASSVSAAEETLRESFKLMRYYALVIGNGTYQSLDNLSTPVKNAEDLRQILRDDYGFEVKLLRNATRMEILDALEEYRRILDDNSSLLVYYAGHGIIEPDTSVTYWQPVDAKANFSSAWIATDEVVNRIRGMKARHVLVVADSCFSGGFFVPHLGGDMTDDEPVAYLKTMMASPSRLAMTSTDLDWVPDIGEDGHTTFTHGLLQGLKNYKNNIFTAKQLFYFFIDGYVIRDQRVVQRPQFGPIPNPSRLGVSVNTGLFIFIRKRH
jgi:WD40 repeat protein